MQQMVGQQPALAWAVSCMTLYDLTIELSGHHYNSYLDEEPVETWPHNVIRFRVRRPR